MEDALLDQSYGYVENLDDQFRVAQAEIERQLSAWYQRFADNNEVTLAEAKRLLTSGELEEFRWTVEEYIRHGEENALTGAWMAGAGERQRPSTHLPSGCPKNPAPAASRGAVFQPA